MITRRDIGRWRPSVVVFSIVIFVLLPVAAFATHVFNDVPDDSIFSADIEWMRDTGITKGCTADGSLFCPKNNVTREQMSAFMHRLADNQVVDAATVMGFGPGDLKGQQGDPGLQGPTGNPGPPGPEGPAGVSHEPAAVIQTGGANVTLTKGETKTVFDQEFVPTIGRLICQATMTVEMVHTTGTVSVVNIDINGIVGGIVRVADDAPSGTYRYPTSVIEAGPIDGDGTTPGRCLVEATTSSSNGGTVNIIATNLVAQWVPAALGFHQP